MNETIRETTVKTEDTIMIKEADIAQNGNELQSNQVKPNIEETKEQEEINVKTKRKQSPAHILEQDNKKAKLLDPEAKNNNSSSPNASNKDVEYALMITNMPKDWSFMDMKYSIDMQCGPVDEIEMIKDDNHQTAIRVVYETENECKKALEKLSKSTDPKFTVSMKVIDLSENENVHSPQPTAFNFPVRTLQIPPRSQLTWRPNMDPWDIDPKGLYGLKKSFLNSLKITPPLDKWVQVTNFRCEKPDLRDVMELAGHVLQCTIVQFHKKIASVEYSHPLEAVQAISMLNGQIHYGQHLKVTMFRTAPNTKIITKGLKDIGPGLGAHGKPLSSVATHYKRMINKEKASLNRQAFEIDDELLEEESEFTIKSIVDIEPVETPEDTENENENAKEAETKSEVPEKSTPKQNNNITSISTPRPAKPVKQKKPAIQNTPRKPTPVPRGASVGPFGQPKPVWQAGPGPNAAPLGPRPGPRMGWNGPGPLGSMQGPRPMGPPGPMGPQRPMGSPSPMGPQVLIGGPMGGAMGASMPGPVGSPMAGAMGGPMGGAMGGPMGGAMGGPMGGAMGGPMGCTLGGPMAGPVGGPMGGAMGGPMGGPVGGGMGGPMGPMQGPINPMQNMNMSSPMQRPMGSPAHVMGGPMQNPNEPVQLQLSNLPPSTTFGVLCERMAAVGTVLSIQLTTPGAAVVTFANRAHADNCYKTYHNFCVEGCVIQVKYT